MHGEPEQSAFGEAPMSGAHSSLRKIKGGAAGIGDKPAPLNDGSQRDMESPAVMAYAITRYLHPFSRAVSPHLHVFSYKPE